MAEGTIKRKTDRGYGFIRTDSGSDLFFHASSVRGTTFEHLEEGQRVSYQIASEPRGQRADAVSPLEVRSGSDHPGLM